ncbi:pentatricopeptide repeat-containing protein At3g49740 [Prunus avium]|uniref:Pentatricopeptide repeat-containing protein At3g49740 n=2 Tax=Prunus avium TaxID=42229 RepID=A0A6P5RF15_PRUAV|nr:pentatricopeptide repeat-containing protein At3g49740 [Prunus avium]
MKFHFYKETTKTIAEVAGEQILKLNQSLAKLTRSHCYSEALQLFTQILSSQSVRPDHYTLSAAVTACANSRDVVFGTQLHAHAIRTGLKAYPHVANTLLSVYAKAENLNSVKLVFDEIENPDVYSWTTLLSACTKLGHVDYASKLFDTMSEKRNVAIWNAMITGCAENGCEEVAIGLFGEMHRMGVMHDNYSFASVLSSCALEGLGFGRQVHTLVIKTGFLGRSSVVNALLTMYFNCRSVLEAFEVFEEAEDAVYDQITFNVMIDGLVNVGRDEEALKMFKLMQEVCLRPTELTFVSVMSSCSAARVANHIHAQAIKLGFEAFTSVSNAAITMYSGCGDLHAAYLVFQVLEEKDLISWNTMISTYSQGNSSKLAILIYRQMQRAAVKPDEFTFGSLLASSEFTETVQAVQALAQKDGLILNIQVSNALVSAYAKQGNMNLAYQVFKDINHKNLISWNAIISGFLLNGLVKEGLEQFLKLLMSEHRPDVCTLTSILSICASISALRDGKQVHGYILKFGFSPQMCLCNTLITVYAKCGVIDWSVRVFNAMPQKDTVSWNSLISAYAQHGQGNEAVRCFEAMQDSAAVKPDQATFTAVLSACSHSGLVVDGTRIFNSMINDYGFMPQVDHFSCIVDLLGRAGYLDEAETVINSKHIKAHPNIWWTLISSCAAHGNLRLGRTVAGFLLETEQNNPTVYVLLASIYAAAGQWEEAANVRELMNRTGVVKTRGCSWIES